MAGKTDVSSKFLLYVSWRAQQIAIRHGTLHLPVFEKKKVVKPACSTSSTLVSIVSSKLTVTTRPVIKSCTPVLFEPKRPFIAIGTKIQFFISIPYHVSVNRGTNSHASSNSRAKP